MSRINSTNQERNKTKRFFISNAQKSFKALKPRERLVKLYDYFHHSEVLFTSSFGGNSAYLLFLLSKVNPQQKVHFIDTGYLFNETIEYKNKLSGLLNLQVEDLIPDVESHNLTKEDMWWKEHPKMCCAINKIAPLNRIKRTKKIWISGLLGFQTDFRSNLNIFADQGDIIKFHPLIDITEGELLYQIGINALPYHPLVEKGYGSIGCINCTVKGEGREGRWADTKKTECGLHTQNFENKKHKTK